jgi:predicted RNA binding protein YcfA (HicA-like mRNA interferase family)
VKVREILDLLAQDGWQMVATREATGSSSIHRSLGGRVTVAGKPSDDLHPKTATSILRQAGLRQ